TTAVPSAGVIPALGFPPVSVACPPCSGDVLGLDTDPTSTEVLTLGSHQARREQWTNECGYVVLAPGTRRWRISHLGDGLRGSTALVREADVPATVGGCGTTMRKPYWSAALTRPPDCA